MLELDSMDALYVLEEQEELGLTAIDLSLPPRITQVKITSGGKFHLMTSQFCGKLSGNDVFLSLNVNI